MKVRLFRRKICRDPSAAGFWMETWHLLSLKDNRVIVEATLVVAHYNASKSGPVLRPLGGDGRLEKQSGNKFDAARRMVYDRWAKLKGTPPEEARQGYIDLVEDLKK